jgi:hypothetical protein
LGTKHDFTSITDVAAHMQGKWLSCMSLAGGGIGSGAGNRVGFEIPGDGSYITLLQDDQGNIVRGEQGTIAIVAASPQDGPEPYTIQLARPGNTGTSLEQPLASDCPRALSFTWANIGSGNGGLYIPVP